MLKTGVSRSKTIRATSIVALALAAAAPVVFAGSTPATAQQDGGVGAFYQARGGRPLWFSPRSGTAAQQLVQLLQTARADNRNPGRYHAGNVARAIRDAQSGNPDAIRRADMELSQAFVAYVQDLKRDPGVGIIYVDPELRPAPPSASAVLSDAASAPSLSDYIGQMQFMNPIYASLRQAIASRIYGNAAQQRLLVLNLERARALPSGRGRYVIVNPPAARLYMYENGRVVDSMRVVAGRPGAISETPMMNAFIRYVALNPYWNSPPDITARKLAPKVLTGGRSYLAHQGYEVVDQFGPNGHVLNPMSVDWRGVVAGRVQVNLRQKPGPANSMGRMKFMFPNAQGIWLHDTPEKEKIEDAARLQSNGCVRLEDARRLERWLFNGRPPNAQGARPEQKVNLPQMVPVYITYLTAVPSGTQIVYFDDFYGKDQGQMRSMRMASLF
ncbi:L,D-transpeptidase family protein [Sphingomonas sp.]|uniref:L,D-transpeptidase family protein n=1 Tax=Sphingomonas sp. TaxID=28214 RepID=UPI0025DCEF04|nr:L,D-transpeptidase family protein [Sphingomonas sp.]MBV9527564.1 L,D-transpeptidase family protein [Sphingomonas sp.]